MTTREHGLSADKDREFICPECNNRCTRGLRNDIEYGHAKGARGNTERCSRRSEQCDPNPAGEYPDRTGGTGGGWYDE